MSDDNEEEVLNPFKYLWSKKRIIMIEVVILALILCVMDMYHQKKLSVAKEGYALVEHGFYQEAEMFFRKYECMQTPLEWQLEQFVNGKDSEYGKEKIEAAIEECYREIERRKENEERENRNQIW